jgi:hypothetical protein
MLDLEVVVKSRTRLRRDDDAIRPALSMTGLAAWVEPESERIMAGLWS